MRMGTDRRTKKNGWGLDEFVTLDGELVVESGLVCEILGLASDAARDHGRYGHDVAVRQVVRKHQLVVQSGDKHHIS